MNINGLDLNLLVAFEALLDERHVGHAAKRIGLSQPAFSSALNRLRSSFDDPLFIRTAQGMLPTARAEQLGGAIRSALSLLRQTLGSPRTFDPGISEHRFRVAMSDDVELRLVPSFARSLSTGSLQVQTRRLDGIFTIPETDLRSGALDLAVGYFPDARSLSHSFVLETLAHERNVVIARRRHPAFRQRLTLPRLAELNQAAVIYRSEPWGLIDNELAARGFRRRLGLALPHCLSVLHAVASSDLVACVQESVAYAFGPSLGLVVRPEPIGLPPFVLRMAWHRDRTGDPAQQWLRGLIQNEIGSVKSRVSG